MKLRVIVFALAGCASQLPNSPPPAHDYGGFRKPSEFEKHEQDQPFVPPPGKPEPSAPKVDPCARPCSAFQTADAESDRLATRCQKHKDELGHTNTDICRQKTEADQKYIAAKNALGSCACE